MKTNIDTIREALADIKYTLKLPLELRGKFETSTRSAICQVDTLLEALAALSTIEADELERVKKERDDYKLWWEGATETHTKIRKLYDEQNTRLWAILKRPGCPEGLGMRMLKMPEADRDYFLSLAVEDIDPDAIKCQDSSDLVIDIRNELTLDESIIAMQKHDDAIRSECADRFIKNYVSDRNDDGIAQYETVYEMFRAWIIGTKPARESSRPISFDGYFYVFTDPTTGKLESYSTYKNAVAAFNKIIGKEAEK